MSSFILSSRRFFLNKPWVVQRSFQSCRTQLRDYVEPTARGPLEGIRVLDLTRVLGKAFYKII